MLNLRAHPTTSTVFYTMSCPEHDNLPHSRPDLGVFPTSTPVHLEADSDALFPARRSIPRTYKGSAWGTEGRATHALSNSFALTAIGSSFHPRSPQHALQDAHGVKISRRASRAPFVHSITFHSVVGPFHYPSRIHRWHEHHEHDVRNYCLQSRCR